MRGPGRGQSGEELADGAAAQGVAPTGNDLGQRREHEEALPEAWMRDEWARPAPGTFRPEDDVEIEHARPPAFPGAAAEAALHRLEFGKQLVGVQRTFQ